MSLAAQIYPQPEYVFVFGSVEANFAKNFMSGYKIINPASIRGKSPEYVYELFIAHLDELQEVYESLIDEESKKTFRGFWLGRISNQISSVIYANTPQYICAGFIPPRDAIVIDCGAYDGATSAHFAGMGYKVYSFEIEKKLYARAHELAKEKNFIVENLGLGSHKHEMKYLSAGAATRFSLQGTDTAQVITLDSYIGEKQLPRVDFIKMDVEGAELDILKGAATVIARYKPILALSAYHKLDDFWTLTKFIKSLRPDYEFALRQYATTPEDIADWFSKEMLALFEAFGINAALPNYEECVLFAR